MTERHEREAQTMLTFSHPQLANHYVNIIYRKPCQTAEASSGISVVFMEHAADGNAVYESQK